MKKKRLTSQTGLHYLLGNNIAVSRKEAKYTSLTNSYIFSANRCVQCQFSVPSSPLWADAWRAPPATCARCHIYSKDSRSSYCTTFQFGLNTRELCSCWWRTGPLAIPTFDFWFQLYVLALGIFTTEGENQNNENYNNNRNILSVQHRHSGSHS